MLKGKNTMSRILIVGDIPIKYTEVTQVTPVVLINDVTQTSQVTSDINDKVFSECYKISNTYVQMVEGFKPPLTRREKRALQRKNKPR